MRPPGMIPTLERVRNLPDVDFRNPPLPGLGVEQVCRRPLEVSLKRSDVRSNRFSISSASFNGSTFGPFLIDFSIDNLIEIPGIRVHVVGETGIPAILRLSNDDCFHYLTCNDGSWHQLCVANNLRDGDKVGLWLFTRKNAAEELWLAIVVTQKRRYRSIARM